MAPSRQDTKTSPNSNGVKTGEKRAATAEKGESPNAKRGKTEKGQMSIEDSLGVDANGIEDDSAVAEQIDNDDEDDREKKLKAREDAVKLREEKVGKTEGSGVKEGEKNAFEEVKSDTGDVKKAAEEEQETKSKEIEKNDGTVVEDAGREAEMPSSILEKGIIYFLFRARVNVEDPQGLEDVARSYVVLRPLPIGAKLGDGTLPDDGNARLLSLPKKMFPKSKQNRFLMFVDKPKTNIRELREQFGSNEYATKTVGTSHTPSITPFAEGVYALTTTGRDSHLAYHITHPTSVGDIQHELGIQQKGSFLTSVKNPKAPGPANASLDNPAEYPEELQKKFRELRWMPLEPALLDYESTQMLIIGEDFEKGVQELSKDERDGDKEKPEDVLEKLEEEDHARVEHLKEDDPVFADLGLSSQEYSRMQTTW